MRDKPVRVAFFESRYYSLYGAQQSMLTLLGNLDRQVVEPIVVLTKDDALSAACRERDVPVVIVPLEERANVFGKQIPQYSWSDKLRVGLALVSLNWRLWRWLRAERVDYVYCNDLRSLVYVAPAARLLRLPVLWYVRDDQRLGLLQGIGVRLATRIVTIADGVRRAFTDEEQRVFADKFRTVHTGFPIAAYAFDRQGRAVLREKWGTDHETFVIGLVGSTTPRKGHDLLVNALAERKSALGKFKVVFVGDATGEYNDYRVKLDQEIERAGLTSQVIWLGRRSDMSAVYSALDLLVLPSRAEGLPRTVCEALLVGVPAVVADVGGVRDVLNDERLGWVVPPNDSGALGEAIVTACPDQQGANSRLRAYRRRFIEDHFTVEAYVKGITNLISEDLYRASSSHSKAK